MKIYYTKKLSFRRCQSDFLLNEMISRGLFGSDRYLFDHDEHGAPVLSGEGLPKLYISISDNPKFWCCAISRIPVGIDIEDSSRKVKPATLKALHPLERKYLEPLDPSGREFQREFLSIWTRKEAYSKLCGVGMAIGFRNFSVLNDLLEYKEIIAEKRYIAGKILEIEAPEGLVCALAIDSDMFAIYEHDLDPKEDFSVDFEPLNIELPFAVSAMEKAAELLDMRSYTQSELASRLIEKGYPKDDARAAALEMKNRGYIDDYAFGLRLAEKYLNEGKGKTVIQNKLREKGIDPSMAKDITEEIYQRDDTPSESERALAEARKILRGKEGPLDDKLKAKIARRLSSLGYSASVIYSTLDKLSI